MVLAQKQTQRKMEPKTQKQNNATTSISSLTKEVKSYRGGNTAYLTNETCYLHIEELNYTISHSVQKSTSNRTKILM
jgi:hypothetical protein